MSALDIREHQAGVLALLSVLEDQPKDEAVKQQLERYKARLSPDQWASLLALHVDKYKNSLFGSNTNVSSFNTIKSLLASHSDNRENHVTQHNYSIVIAVVFFLLVVISVLVGRHCSYCWKGVRNTRSPPLFTNEGSKAV